MREKLSSRKLWIGVITQILVVIVVAVLDLPEEQATTIVTGLVGTASAYMLGQGYADGNKTPKASTPPAPSDETS